MSILNYFNKKRKLDIQEPESVVQSGEVVGNEISEGEVSGGNTVSQSELDANDNGPDTTDNVPDTSDNVPDTSDSVPGIDKDLPSTQVTQGAHDKKSSPNFQQSWLTKWPWLRNTVNGMTCHLCLKHGKSNKMTAV